MSDGPDTTKMRGVAREEAAAFRGKGDEEAARAERLLKEKHSTQIGWAIAITGAGVLFLTLAAYLFLPVKPTVPAVLGLAGLAVLLAFGGGALVQGTRLDRILMAWKKGAE